MNRTRPHDERGSDETSRPLEAHDDRAVYMPQNGGSATLTLEGGAEYWRLRMADGHVTLFNQFGYMTDRRDRFGNGVMLVQEPTELFTVYYRYCYRHREDPEFQEDMNKDMCVFLSRVFEDAAEFQIDVETGWDGTQAKLPLEHRGILPIDAPPIVLPLQEELDAGLRPVSSHYHVHLQRGRQQALYLMSKGALARPPTGVRRMRPVAVIDDLKRKLLFRYHKGDTAWESVQAGEPDEMALMGLLEEVRGPETASVAFSYDSPPDYPGELGEEFLAEVTRSQVVPPAPGSSIGESPTKSVQYVGCSHEKRGA